jgi:signal transduction histidine kinase/ligand-binding sensor domain-containing protein
MQKLWVTLIIIFCSTIIRAQDLRITTYQVEQGLPNPLTKAIGQDDLGFIWIATDLGLVRFDGKQFTLFSDALPTIYIKSFYKAKNGDFMVIHDMGLTKITHTTDTLFFTNLINGSRDLTDSTLLYPKIAHEDSKGRFWISQYKNVTLYNDGQIKHYYLDDHVSSISFNRSFQFAEDKFGTFWLFSQQGFILYFDEEEDTFVEVKNLPFELGSINDALVTPEGEVWLATTYGVQQLITTSEKEILGVKEISDLQNISCFAVDQSQEYYLGTWYKGLYRGKLKNGKLDLKPVTGLNQKVINCIFVNNQNEIWSSADEGISLLQKTFFTKLSINSDRTFMLSMFCAKNGNIYTTNGGIVIEITKQNEGYQAKHLYDIEESETIQNVVFSNNTIYYSTNKENIYWIDVKGKKGGIKVPSKGGLFYMTADRNGNIWICQGEKAALIKLTPEKKLVYYEKEEGIEGHMLVVRENERGELYAGGRGENSYLYKYDEQTDSFKNISLPVPVPTKDYSVDDIAFDKNGALWLASNNGLFKFAFGAIKKVDHGKIKGINVIKAIAVNKIGYVWIGTDFGLFQYDGNEFTLYEDFNGLPAKPIGYRCLTIDPNNGIWVGTVGGVGYTFDGLLPLKKTITPIFLSLEMNGQKIKPTQNIFINSSYLEAKFVSTTYPSNKLNYQYKLEGYHQDWIELGDKSDILIPNIPFGSFTLRVRASQQGEYTFSDHLTYNFKIVPAWYITKWAFMAYFVLLVIIIIGIVKLNTARLLKEKEKLEQIVRERTLQISQQKEEIESQRDNLIELNAEIVSQKEEIEAQRDNLIVLNQEISDQKNKVEEKSMQLETAFNEITHQKQELEKLNATKNRFFSIVAHDLKGPINSLASFSDLLANYADAMTPEEIKKVAIDLSKAVKNTSNLTENLLTWARSQMEKLTHKPQAVSVMQIMEENKTVLANTAETKNITIHTKISDDFKVWADKDQLTFVVRNLISNALKFTQPGGSITIIAHSLSEHAEISIMDTGVGMPEAVCKNIFNIDSKHSTIGTSGEKGTGLGLLLCKEFVEKNGGKIWVTSKEKEGSTFSFSLKTYKEELAMQ